MKYLFRLFLLGLVALGAAMVADRQGWISLPWPLGASDQTASPARAGRGRGGNSDAAIPILAVAAKVEDVPVIVEAVGTVQAFNTVTVRSQVDGKLIELAFKEGDEVKKGDVLARIDAATYQAQYDQVVAKKAQDEAQLANARVDLERYTTLAKGDFGSKQQADTQRALVAQLTAQLRLDQAAIDNAKAILDYTTVRAPIDGRTGIRAVDVGNIIRSSDTAGLVTITQLKPIALVFNLPQQQLRAVGAAMARGSVPVRAYEGDNRSLLDEGVIEVIDNQVDPTTGTVKIKARFANERLQLWPGQFVNVRIVTDILEQVTTVPSAALQRGPNGPFVYVVNEGGAVKMTTVRAGLQTETLVVIENGVAPGQQVATTGFARLTDGAKVTATAPEAVPPPPPLPQDRRRQGRGAGGARPDGAAAPGASQQGQPGQVQPGQGQQGQGQQGQGRGGPRPDGAGGGQRRRNVDPGAAPSSGAPVPANPAPVAPTPAQPPS